MSVTHEIGGWAFPVFTKYIDGQGEMICLYAVAEPDQERAILLLRDRLGPDERVEAPHPLLTATLHSLRMASEQVAFL